MSLMKSKAYKHLNRQNIQKYFISYSIYEPLFWWCFHQFYWTLSTDGPWKWKIWILPNLIKYCQYVKYERYWRHIQVVSPANDYYDRINL